VAARELAVLPLVGSRSRTAYFHIMRPTLAVQLAAHLAEPFPASVEKGAIYGEVDAVMVDADIYGWAMQDPLRRADRPLLLETTEKLRRSLSAFPPEARPYYERLLQIAQAASGG